MAELAARLGEDFVYHQWFQYFHQGGMGFCECDGFIELEDEVILFEVKLTGGPHGKLQMEGLYKPLLEWCLGKPVRCLLVVKNKTGETPGPFLPSSEEFIKSKKAFACWHWIGV